MHRRDKRMIAFLLCVIAILFLFSLVVGKYPITAADVWSAFFGGELTEMKRQVFWGLRFSRTVMVLLAGLGLSLAGSVFQTVFRNPLASPDIIGVTSGANVGAAVAIVLFGSSTLALAFNAFLGGVLVIVILLFMVYASRSKGTSDFILVGIIIKSIAEATVMSMKFFADPEKELAAIEYWAMGSFANITMEKLIAILPFYCVGVCGIVLLRRQLYLLNLSDEESRSLGINAFAMRLIILIFATLLVSSIICMTGLVKFVGLISPHIVRLIRKKEDFTSAIAASLTGGVILLLADCIVRMVHEAVVPVSIITTLIATPFLAFYLVRRRGRAYGA